MSSDAPTATSVTQYSASGSLMPQTSRSSRPFLSPCVHDQWTFGAQLGYIRNGILLVPSDENYAV